MVALFYALTIWYSIIVGVVLGVYKLDRGNSIALCFTLLATPLSEVEVLSAGLGLTPKADVVSRVDFPPGADVEHGADVQPGAVVQPGAAGARCYGPAQCPALPSSSTVQSSSPQLTKKYTSSYRTQGRPRDGVQELEIGNARLASARLLRVASVVGQSQSQRLARSSLA
jgi:hypothetical protein